MLLVGPPNLAPIWRDNLIVLNFTSMIEGLDTANLLPPPYGEGLLPDYDFDMYYANWLLNDILGFDSLMRVMYLLYSGYDIYLCVGWYSFTENINESLLKFIQSRYGYIGYIINEIEDLNFVKEGEFSLGGISNLDMDKARYAELAVFNIISGRANSKFYSIIIGDEKALFGSIKRSEEQMKQP